LALSNFDPAATLLLAVLVFFVAKALAFDVSCTAQNP
jgi:hypothetical protein